MSAENVLYSDGEIEDLIIEELRCEHDVLHIPYSGGAIFHNFTDARENLLNWYPFEANSSILEIGAGMGALTGLLCDKATHVTALEQSPKRAEIIRQRYKNKDNLEVICDDIFSHTFSQTYDYILLIGVLEYVGIGTKDADPYSKLLKRIHSLLSGNGIMLLAIENRFGLKYWCGAAEDHTGNAFDGISGYEQNDYTSRYEKGGVRTFSRADLSNMLSVAGFSFQHWYYPLPDYKFPMAIFSDDKLPQEHDIASIKFGYPIESELIADERKLYKDIIANEAFPFFSNSFLVEASVHGLPESYIKYVSFKRDYKTEYQVFTSLTNDNKVVKQSCNGQAVRHIENIVSNTLCLQKQGVTTLPISVKNHKIIQDWQNIPRSDTIFKKYLKEHNTDKIFELLNLLKTELLKSSPYYEATTVSIDNHYNIKFDSKEIILSNGFVDMTFANSFYDGTSLCFFDQEWKYSNVPLKYIIYRSVRYAGSSLESSFYLNDILDFLEISASLAKTFEELEAQILLGMMDKQKCDMLDPGMYHEGLLLRHHLDALRQEVKRLEKEKQNCEHNFSQYRQLLVNHLLTLTESLPEEGYQTESVYTTEIGNEQLDICTRIDEIIKNFKAARDAKLASLSGTLAQAEEQIRQLEQSVKNQKGHIELLLEVEREYEREKASRTYQLALKFRRASLALLPVASKRRFFVKIFIKGLRHPLLFLKMVNPRRVKNCFIILKSEGIKSAFNHLRLVEEYEKSRTTPLPEDFTLIPVSEKEKCLEDYPKLVFPKILHPQVSIIIPVYNQFDYTYHCLESILKNSGDFIYEIIIANDCSTDLTKSIDQIVDGIRVINNKTNLRFLRNCNNAAQYAKGEYIVFLNNDTQVQADWLAPLIQLFVRDTQVGMAGSKLIYSNGQLQEAGGILWKDASAWNYGNNQNPNDSEFNYVHEADYISGAAIMIRSSLWQELGGFDTRYSPAYCEDSDLAFEVRKAGYKVLYQPKSVVVHFEGVSNGTDLSGGQKKYQLENQKKFYEKWRDVLEEEHFENGCDVFLARDRGGRQKHVLVIDHYVPQYDKDAGSKTTFMYLKMLIAKGFHVTFLGDNFYRHEPYTAELQQLGVLVLYGPKYAENYKQWLLDNAAYFDVFYLNRPHITVKYIDLIKKAAKGKIIYYGHDFHYLRLRREYELSKNQELLRQADDWLEKELHIMRKTDMNYYPSAVECGEIHKIDPSIPVKAITAYVYDGFRDIRYTAAERSGLLFVGGFGHTPNADGVLWFVENVYPSVYEKTGAPFYIVGSKAPKEITQITAKGVVVKGFVSEPELLHLYDSCRIAVVPLRYGAGVKGKVVEALYHGVPIVTTSVGAEGIPGLDGIAVIEDTAEKMINAICSLYNDVAMLTDMSEKSQSYVREAYSTAAVWNNVMDDFI